MAVLQLRNYVDDSQHGTFRALGVARMGRMERMDGRGVQQSAEEDGRERLEFCVCIKSFGRHDKSANALRLRQILKSIRMR